MSCKDLKETLLDFIADLKDNIFYTNEEKGELMLVEFFFKRLHTGRVMQHILKHVVPHKKMIKNRDLDFFIENRSIFSGLPEDRIDHYSDVLSHQTKIDDDDMNVIWQYFETMIAIAEQYKKNK